MVNVLPIGFSSPKKRSAKDSLMTIPCVLLKAVFAFPETNCMSNISNAVVSAKNPSNTINFLTVPKLSV